MLKWIAGSVIVVALVAVALVLADPYVPGEEYAYWPN